MGKVGAGKEDLQKMPCEKCIHKNKCGMSKTCFNCYDTEKKVFTNFKPESGR